MYDGKLLQSAPVREFGAVEWQDLAELEEADAASLGIRRIEFRRLMRVVESHAGT